MSIFEVVLIVDLEWRDGCGYWLGSDIVRSSVKSRPFCHNL